jgi:ribose transport system permease protein
VGDHSISIGDVQNLRFKFPRALTRATDTNKTAIDDAMKSFLSSPAARASLALGLVLLTGVVFNADGAFFKVGTHRDTLRQMSVYGILACGLTPVIISGGIDLAVGSVLALTAVCCAKMAIHWNWPGIAVLFVTLFSGAFCGGASGLVAARLRVQPFIATLAMMVLARGLAKYASSGMKVSTAIATGDGNYRYVEVPKLFRFVDGRILGGNVSVVTIIFLMCAVFAWLLMSQHLWGRYIYAIGGNETASRFSAVPVVSVKMFTYIFSGTFAAIAGICQAAQEQQGDPEAGVGYELIAIAMVVIGGTSLAGGRGGIGLTLLGILTIGYLDKILSINAVPEAGRLVLTGIIIVAAVLTQQRK